MEELVEGNQFKALVQWKYTDGAMNALTVPPVFLPKESVLWQALHFADAFERRVSDDGKVISYWAPPEERCLDLLAAALMKKNYDILFPETSQGNPVFAIVSSAERQICAAGYAAEGDTLLALARAACGAYREESFRINAYMFGKL